MNSTALRGAAKQRFNELLASVGQIGLHSLYPNDFEYYTCAFELVDGSNKPIDLLILPVLPNSISINQRNLVNIQKSAGAVVSLYNPSFAPFEMSLTGTFGRKFRILLGDDEIVKAAEATRDYVKGVRGEKSEQTFNTKIKNGYGTMKVLERLIKGSFDTDTQGRPNMLYFYNFTFNHNYLVEVVNHNFTMDERSNNMFWNYQINMTAIAPALSVRGISKSSLTRLVAIDEANQYVNSIAGGIVNALRTDPRS